jgi:hypothetical protein
MDALIQQFDNIAMVHHRTDCYNTSEHMLVCMTHNNVDHVITYTDIEENDIIGYIDGEQKYAYEIEPNKYCIWIDDTIVIDCSETPRCITSMIREGFYEGLVPNCKLEFIESNSEIMACVRAIKKIFRGEELIIYKDYY